MNGQYLIQCQLASGQLPIAVNHRLEHAESSRLEFAWSKSRGELHPWIRGCLQQQLSILDRSLSSSKALGARAGLYSPPRPTQDSSTAIHHAYQYSAGRARVTASLQWLKERILHGLEPDSKLGRLFCSPALELCLGLILALRALNRSAYYYHPYRT